ncbi:MAG: NADH-quinone oxidoreductase subunit L [Aquificae bacterium]|nr:NADH-quinone oxidoreductase subunit L [Aquificota bacterium]
MEHLILLIILVQLSSAVIAYLHKNELLGAKLSTSLTLTNFFLSLFLLITGSFGSFSLFGVLDFLPDRLGLLLSTYILLVSAVVHKYAENYMREDEGFRRFYLLLDLMTANLILLVVAGNLLLLLFAWHAMGVLLFFMLNHNYENPRSVRFANLAFITHRLADAPLLLGIVLLFWEFGTLKINELEKLVLSYEGESFTLFAVPLLVVVSAMIKSAQIPFHLWLVYSMEGPTPVSALMHAGIVNAGAFLVNRLAFVFTHENVALHLAFFVGSITAIVGSALMLIQNDIKKSLGYSTVGQMGYMVMEFGIGAFALAVYHMMAHGIFKATLFLYSGNVIHSARKDPNIPEDEVYRAVTRGYEVVRKVPWFTYALLTLMIPLLIVLLVHFAVEKHFLKYETQLIILFFAWATAAQTVISTFRAERERPLLSALVAILSLLVFLLGYVLLGHGLARFLYPNEEVLERIYEKSFSDPLFLYGEMVLIALIILAGWVFIYYASDERFLSFNLSIYTHLSRELYFTELYEFVKGAVLALSRALRSHGVSLALGALTLLYLAGELSTRETLRTVLAGFFVPLFPMGYVTVLFLKRAGLYWFLLLPLLGVIVLSSYIVPEEVRLAGALSFGFFALRALSVNSLRELSAELFGALFGVIWALKGAYVYIPLLMVGPALVVYLSLYLERLFGHTQIGFYSGLFGKMPRFSVLLILSALYAYMMPLLVSYVPFHNALVENGKEVDILLLLSWVVLSVALLERIGRVLFFRGSDDFIYKDLGPRALWLGVFGFLVSLLVGFYFGGRG